MRRTQTEFAAVDVLLNSSYQTRTTDAFILSYVKFEKQMRRLVFYLLRQRGVSQSLLRQFSNENDRLDYKKFKGYFDKLHSRPFFDVLDKHLGMARRKIMWHAVESYRHDRGKIFHGLLTDKGLTADDLKTRVNTLRGWCESVGSAMQTEIGYDGLRKSPTPWRDEKSNGFQQKTARELRQWLEAMALRR